MISTEMPPTEPTLPASLPSLFAGARPLKGTGGLRSLLAATMTLWAKGMTKFWRSREELGGLAIQPILWVLLFGVGMERLMQAGGARSDGPYLTFMLPGVVALSALGGAVGGGMAMLEERLHGVMREYLVAPIPRASILLSYELTTVTKSLFQAAIVLGLGLVMGALPVANLLALLGGLLLLGGFALGFSSLALALAARMRSIMGYHGIIALFNLPLLFGSTALYPLEVLPGWLRVLVLLNPTSYLVDGLRALWYGLTPTFPLPLTFLVIWGFALATTLMVQRAFTRALAQDA